MPRLLRDILEDVLRSQDDMDVVGRGGDAELIARLERQEVDVVITTSHDDEGAVSRRTLLSAPPALKIVTMPASGRFANVMEFRQLSMMEPSPQMLVQAIR